MSTVQRIADRIEALGPDDVYFDMDGVLANWAAGVATLFGKDPSRVAPCGRGTARLLGVSDNVMWRAVEGAGMLFWETLPVIQLGLELWFELRERFISTCVLTSPSRHPSSGSGKMAWLQKHLSTSGHLDDYVITSQKWRLAKPGAVLIDDYVKHTDAFDERGGTGFLWPNDFAEEGLKDGL